MSYDIARPFPIGSYRASTSTALAGLLGTVTVFNNKTYRLVQNSGTAITTPQGKVLVTALTLGVPTYVVAISDATTGVGKAGVISSDYGTTTIPADAYFWLQVSGPTSVLSATTTITTGLPLGPSTAGTAVLIATSVAGGVAIVANIGYSTNSAAVTTAGTAITMILDGILP